MRAENHEPEPAGAASLRLAIIGCGAATRLCHLPALAAGSPFELVALVDRDLGHARDAAAEYQELLAGVRRVAPRPVVTDDATAVPVDAAIVATPHATHVDIAAALAEAGIHVLVEKPMAMDAAGAERLIRAAAAGGAHVVPAHPRRLFPATRWVRAQLESGALGALRRVEWQEGQPYSWPVTTGFMFSAAAGGGVLMDSGPHVFDVLAHWLGGPVRVDGHADNGAGGAESETRTELVFGDVPATVLLSRLRALPDRCVLEGERASLEVTTRFTGRYRVTGADGAVREGDVPVLPAAEDTWVGMFQAQLADFSRVAAGHPPRVAGFADGEVVAGILDSCRGAPGGRLARPWEGPLPDVAVPTGPVAVTGATGFIGAHVVDRLMARGAAAVAVVRDLAKLARISHHDPARLATAVADARDRDALAEAFRGCDTVVHTVYGTEADPQAQWSVTVDGTAAVLAAAAKAGVRRVVHVGTVAVYDSPGHGAVDELTPRLPARPGDLGYAQQKLAADALLDDAPPSLEVVCVQPTVVYGPWAPSWTMAPLRRLRAGEPLPTGGAGSGVCNAVHVHDVADALLVAAAAGGVEGESLLVSGPDTVSWGAFYDAYRAMLGLEPPGSLDAAQLEAWESDLYADGAVVATDRLRKAGFVPRVGFEAGMAHVAAWARWAGILGR